MLRLFERGHMPMINGFERLTRWLVDAIAHHTDNGSYEAALEPVTIANLQMVPENPDVIP